MNCSAPDCRATAGASAACGGTQDTEESEIPAAEDMLPQATETVESPQESAGATHTNAFDFERKSVLLNNGMEMPIIGISIFTLSNEQAKESVYQSLTRGGRLVDTASAYGNEEGVGRGIKRSSVPREEIFVTTKLWPDSFCQGVCNFFSGVL